MMADFTSHRPQRNPGDGVKYSLFPNPGSSHVDAEDRYRRRGARKERGTGSRSDPARLHADVRPLPGRLHAPASRAAVRPEAWRFHLPCGVDPCGLHAGRHAPVGAIYRFSGVGLACFSPAMMSYVGDVSPVPFLGRAYGWYTSALYLGMAAGPGLGGALAGGGFGTAFLLSAIALAAGLLLGGPRMPAPPPVIRLPSGHLLADFREITRNRAVLACWPTTFFP